MFGVIEGLEEEKEEDDESLSIFLVPVDLDYEPIQAEAPTSLNRTPTFSTVRSFVSASKRPKMDSLIIPAVRKIPSSVREWSQRVNERWTPPGPNTRRASSDLVPSSRPTKRFKLDTTVPRTSKEWVQMINDKHQPTMSVISEGPEEEEDDESLSNIPVPMDLDYEPIEAEEPPSLNRSPTFS